MKVKSESEVTQLCPTLCDPMDCSLPGSSIHGILRQEYWNGVPLPSPHVMYTTRYIYVYVDTHTHMIRAREKNINKIQKENFRKERLTFILNDVRRC